MTESLSKINRRSFVSGAGKALLMAGLGANSVPEAGAAPKVRRYGLTDLAAESEKEAEDAPAPLPHDKRIKFALVGLGHLTLEEIMPAFAQSKMARVTALVSGHKDKALQVADHYNIDPKNIYGYDNYNAIADNADIDAVYIVLPNSMHCQYTVRAAKAGKHVLCEKPMATSSKDCRTMIEACKQANKKLMIAYRIQYEPNNSFIRDLVRNKTYGAVKMIEASNGQNQGDPNQWRQKIALSGGGAMPDIGIYCLNTTRALLGEEPNQVFATTYSTPGDPRFIEVEENIAFQLQFPSGVLANCASGYGYHESRQYRVLAERAWFGMEPAFSYNGMEMQLSTAQGKKELFQKPKLGEKNQFALELDHMADCIMNDKQPYTPGEEGLQDQIIIEALYQSAKERKPIILPTVTALDTTRGPKHVV